ncbi:hypothetical protein [Olleya marilimosa]|uniref:Beta-carotene 15,15'-monooxygenase n=1 Tax=Olleya marilimosa TaxID=272164 RepID=A0ABR8LVW1_9FLAO|nr:hypothetical protein [Olleya marilimosa]MBD3862357.1 hypothetical protein [Olleya marilimosa]MBD3889855.1 hypothetical protein [Olleya marilimosa]
MNTKKIDLLNIGLIVISLLIAIKIPFELFLFSYAILGPLHYLTEINWLKDRNYFVQKNIKWTYFFTVFAIILAIYPVYKFLDLGLNNSFNDLLKLINQNTNALLLIGFMLAVGLIFVSKVKHLILILFIAVVLAFTLTIYVPKYLLFIGLFLPTLIHVYLFTFLFIVFGALKAKSKYGFILAFILLCVPIIIWKIPINAKGYNLSQSAIDTYVDSNMMGVNSTIAGFLNLFENGKFYALSEVGLKIQIFIGFAYTYHYLNWFSKTSIIGWQKAISVRKGLLILGIWIASIALYLYDYKTGLVAIFFLSFLHVFLEFPLNALTIKEVFSIKNYKLK